MIRRKNLAIEELPRIDSLEVVGKVNRFLVSHVGTVYCAGTPVLSHDGDRWTVPILYATPGFVAGQVGQAQVDADTGDILSHTGTDELHRQGRKLGRQYRAEIEAAFLRARKC